MVAAGTPLETAVRMATVNPLRQMGIGVNKGEIKVGYDADLCVFDDNIEVSYVLIAGEIVHINAISESKG